MLAVVEQLQGFELAAGAWEASVLPARVADYRREWLDALCLSGEVVWGRLGLRAPAGGDEAALEPGRGGAVPSRATPIALALREDLPWLLAAARGDGQPTLPGDGAAREVLEALRTRGALFDGELVAATRRLPVEVEQALWDLVARGLVTADGFEPVRLLLGARDRERRGRVARAPAPRLARGARRGPLGAAADGRSRVRSRRAAPRPSPSSCSRAGAWCSSTCSRARRSPLPWREILWALRRLEARGAGARRPLRDGLRRRAVRAARRRRGAAPHAHAARARGEIVRLSGVDPLNLVGILTPGPRIPALRTQVVVYRDGAPVQGLPALSAGAPGLSA